MRCRRSKRSRRSRTSKRNRRRSCAASRVKGAGVQEFRRSGVQESGVQECKNSVSSGVQESRNQEFRSVGDQELVESQEFRT